MAKTTEKNERILTNFIHVTENEQKIEYVKEKYADRISVDEIINSDIWCLVGRKNEGIFSLIMLQKPGDDDDMPENSMKITHISNKAGIYEQNEFKNFFVHIETYYVNNNINCMSVTIPKIRGLTTEVTKFFKSVGYLKYIVNNVHFPDGALYFLKNDIKDWYEEENGEYKPRINN